jgi:hypothetical protein
MKIPVRSGAQVAARPIGTPFGNTNFDTGQGQVTQALNQVGAVAENIADRVAKAAAKADAINVNDAVSRLQDGTNDNLDGNSQKKIQGYLNVKGMAAAEASVPTLEKLEKFRGEIAQELANDRQRKLFAQHSAPVIRGARSRVEGHVNNEREAAEQASIQGRMATSLATILGRNSDDGFAAEEAASVSQMIRAFAKSDEDGDAKELAWNANVTQARLRLFIAKEDDAAADALFARKKELLGVHAADFEHDLSVLRTKKFSETTAKGIVGETADPVSGRVDLAKAYTKVDELPEGKREGVRRLLEDRYQAGEKAWDQKVSGHFDSALTAMLAAKTLAAIKPEDEAFLRQKAPIEWDKLEQKDWAWREFWRRRAAGDRTEKARTTPDQAQNFIRFQAELQEHSEAYKALSDADLKKTWWGKLSDEDYEQAGRMWANNKKDPKDSGADFNKTASEYVNGERAYAGPKKKGERDSFLARVGLLRRAWKEQHGGKEPTAADFPDIRDEANKAQVKEYLGGLITTSKPAHKDPTTAPVLKGKPAAAPFKPGSTVPAGEGTVLRVPTTSTTKPGAKGKDPAVRAAQLKAEGKSRREAFEIMKREGY